MIQYLDDGLFEKDILCIVENLTNDYKSIFSKLIASNRWVHIDYVDSLVIPTENLLKSNYSIKGLSDTMYKLITEELIKLMSEKGWSIK